MTETILIGPGGVGTVVAYGIDFVGKSNLSLVIRRDYEHVKNHGYDIHSCDYGDVSGWKPNDIFPSIEAASKSGKVFDFVIIATKNIPDVIKVEELVGPLVTPEKTAVVLMQNGFDLARPFFSKYPKNVIISGVSHIGSHSKDGVIHQTQKDKTQISYFENPNLDPALQEAKTREFVSIYSNEKIDCQYFPDSKWFRYKKLVYNATMNTTCALTGVDVGRLEFSGGLEAVAIPAMREVMAVARADGVELPEDTINTAIRCDDGDYFEPSMRVDVKKGNPLELEVILGNLLTVARELKVETPRLDMLYDLLKVVQFRLKEEGGYFSLPEKRPITEKFWK